VYTKLKREVWGSRIHQDRPARELKIDETVLSKIINGYRTLSPSVREVLAEYFGREESRLFEGERDLPRRANGRNKSGSRR